MYFSEIHLFLRKNKCQNSVFKRLFICKAELERQSCFSCLDLRRWFPTYLQNAGIFTGCSVSSLAAVLLSPCPGPRGVRGWLSPTASLRALLCEDELLEAHEVFEAAPCKGFIPWNMTRCVNGVAK